MSNTETTTSVNLSSKLVHSGFKKTPLATAIAELVGSYLGVSGRIDGKLLKQLQSTRDEAADLISNTLPDNLGVAGNDEVYNSEDKKAA